MRINPHGHAVCYRWELITVDAPPVVNGSGGLQPLSIEREFLRVGRD